ncbi:MULTISPECIES: DUF3592 domain-containing protein [Streptomyces]|jgi:hypothetical protein|uniref:DUF3592 domain-containing protein n=2 Tax=Streptomyces griseoaurantiacus TaxID=68213 RepID=F3NII6_9ACTN|nr:MULTISPECIES: DUF3592 domain-containing protein [Streptomyces]EGG46822.1 hypothetical protein SGM_2950 [Streptomyces griseoaurantiacus M045]MCF0085280.1 hypothetical protein [Streptomyces sp. MH192]MCF0098119.1 hypothetical protein [Streptomyces sp. MH191]MDX3088151.1 hypothetical protein [Streptomyces sp. ME12-02E]MDX3331507.1 hypothetical protein [Streptomyces sp. ME02-6978a]
MGFLFHFFIPCLLLFLVYAGWRSVVRVQERRAAWASGLTAQGRVVRAWVTTRIVNNVPRYTHWHEYDFTTVDDRAVRFSESGGPRDRAEGERVLVHYTRENPERATAGEPTPGRDSAVLTYVLIILGVGFLVTLWAGVTYW